MIGEADNTGFPKGHCPFGRVWDRVPNRRSRQHRVSKGAMPLLQSPEAAPLAGVGAAPQIDRRSMFTLGALQGVNPQTVQWTVWGEGTLCKRERPLKFPVYFFAAKRKFQCPKKVHLKRHLNKNREKFHLLKG